MKTLFQIIYLQLRIKKNLIISRKYVCIWIFFLAGLLPVLFFISSTNLTYTIITYFKNSIAKNYSSFFSAVFIVFTFATFIYMYIFRMQLNLASHFETGYLPIKKYYFILSDLIFNVVDFWTFLLFALFFSIIIPLEIFSNLLQYVLSGITFLCFIITINLLFRFFIGMFEFLLNLFGNHGSKLFFKSRVLMLILFSTTTTLFYLNGEIKNIVAISSSEFMKYLPAGQTAQAIIKLAEFDERWLLNLCSIICYAGTLYFLVYFMSTTKVKINDEAMVSEAGLRNKNNLNIGDKNLPILFIKEIIYLIRSMRIKLMLLFSIFFSFLYLQGNLYDKGEFSFLNLILLSAGPLYLSFESISVWLHEGPGTKFYFYSNIDFTRLIVMKNLAFFLWVTVAEVISIGVGFIVKPACMIVENIIFSFLFIISFYWLIVIILNYFAFSWPKKVAYEAIFSKSMDASATSIFMIPTIVLFILFYIPFLFIPVITKTLLIMMTFISIIVYGFSLRFIKRHVFEKREYFIETVS